MNRILLIFGLLLQFPFPGGHSSHVAGGSVAFAAAGTITQCNAGTCDASSSNTLSASVTVPSGSNRALVVLVNMSGQSTDTVPAISTVTCEGTQSLSQLSHKESSASHYYVDIWGKNGYQPTVATDTCVVVMASDISGNMHLSVGIISVAGANQTTLVYSGTGGSGAGATGTGTAANYTLPANNANNLGIAGVCGGTDGTFTAGSGVTSRGYAGDNSNACGSFAIGTATGATTGLNWTIPSDSWISTGFQIQP